MSTKEPGLPIAVRIIGCLAGLTAGAVIGGLLLMVVLIFTGRIFGLHNVLPVVAICAGFGTLIGLVFPITAGKAAARLFSSL